MDPKGHIVELLLNLVLSGLLSVLHDDYLEMWTGTGTGTGTGTESNWQPKLLDWPVTFGY